jgi:hypothetical protein
MQNLDLSNQESLDENFLGGLFRNRKTKKEIRGITGCKKPVLNVGKKKKEYEKCLSDYKSAQANKEKELEDAKRKLASSSSSSAAELAAAKKELEAKEQELLASKSAVSKTSEKTETEGDKFLGMPKAVGITVTVVGALALIVGGIFLVKKLRK